MSRDGPRGLAGKVKLRSVGSGGGESGWSICRRDSGPAPQLGSRRNGVGSFASGWLRKGRRRPCTWDADAEWTGENSGSAQAVGVGFRGGGGGIGLMERASRAGEHFSAQGRGKVCFGPNAHCGSLASAACTDLLPPHWRRFRAPQSPSTSQPTPSCAAGKAAAPWHSRPSTANDWTRHGAQARSRM